MTDLERLTALLDNAPADPAGNRNVRTLAEHLLANGVIVPPCKVGGTVFFVGHISGAIPNFIYDDTITKIGVTTRGVMHERGVDFADFGKTVFLTREEAERALKGGAQE